MRRRHFGLGRLLWGILVVSVLLGGVASEGLAQQPQKAPGPSPSGAPPPSPVLSNSIGMEFVRIPAGKFKMGSTTGDKDEKPVREVRISRPFYLGKYEVTQGQWQAVMGSTPSRFTGDPNLPVEQVSWEDVQEFIRKLNAQEGGTKYRLPTEAEWEYAARAGSTTLYSFGDDPQRLAEYDWYATNAEAKTHPVGQKPPNAWGLHDVHGNVWEWVQDWYGRYPDKAVTNPQGPASGKQRVYRGGSWSSTAVSCHSASRGRGIPNTHVGDVGFRLLRTAEP